MTAQTGPRSDTTLQVPLSPLLLGSLIAAIVATLGLIPISVIALQTDPTSPAGSIQRMRIQLAFFGVTALAVVGWLAVICAVSRDQIMRRVDAMEARLLARISEYGEHRRTEGYLDGMREARRQDPPDEAESRLRSVPPPEP